MAQERRLSMTAGILPSSAHELEEMLLLPISGKPDVHTILENYSKDFIDVIQAELEPYEEFAPKAKTFYCFHPKLAHIALSEYKAYLLAGYISTTRESPTLAANFVEKYFGDVFSIVQKVNIQEWFSANGPTNSYPSYVSAIRKYEQKYPHSFDEEAADAFFQCGFGTLFSTCFTQINAHSRTIAGYSPRSDKFRMTDNLAKQVSVKVGQQIESLNIAKKYKNFWEITNVPVARYLQCLQKPELAQITLDTLPEYTVAEFLQETLQTLKSKVKGEHVYRILLSADINSTRSPFLRWMYKQLESRGLTTNISFYDMPSGVQMDFGRGYSLAYIISALKKEVMTKEKTPMNSALKLLGISSIQDKLDQMKFTPHHQKESQARQVRRE
jgi:hypothetical protein